MIETERLRLIPIEPGHRRAFRAGRHELGRLLNVLIPDDWPQFPEALALTAGDAVGLVRTDPWCGYFFIDVSSEVLVGNGGFHGAPNLDGDVEIGYEISAAHRNRGFATEAVRALVRFAFSDPRARGVVAHTLAEWGASNTVLAKAGMRFAGELANAEVGRVWRWRIARDQAPTGLTT